MDGSYSLVAGHVDKGESFLTASTREASEEVGVLVDIKDLNLVYTLHTNALDRISIALFLEAKTWKNEIKNNEPNKCDRIDWFDKNNLPINTVDYVSFAINEINQGKNFGVLGF